MKKIQIFGSGCRKCKKLAEIAEAAAKEVGVEYEIEKITEMSEIVKFGVMTTPALAIDGEIKVAGRVPSRKQIKNFLI